MTSDLDVVDRGALGRMFPGWVAGPYSHAGRGSKLVRGHRYWLRCAGCGEQREGAEVCWPGPSWRYAVRESGNAMAGTIAWRDLEADRPVTVRP